jgi:hypothetical protein
MDNLKLPSREEIHSLENRVRELEAQLSQTVTEARSIENERNALATVVEIQVRALSTPLSRAQELVNGLGVVVQRLVSVSDKLLETTKRLKIGS